MDYIRIFAENLKKNKKIWYKLQEYTVTMSDWNLVLKNVLC